MRNKDEIKDIKETIHQLRMEKAIKELKKEVDRYNKTDIFGRTLASFFKRKRSKKIKKKKNKRNS